MERTPSHVVIAFDATKDYNERELRITITMPMSESEVTFWVLGIRLLCLEFCIHSLTQLSTFFINALLRSPYHTKLNIARVINSLFPPFLLFPYPLFFFSVLVYIVGYQSKPCPESFGTSMHPCYGGRNLKEGWCICSNKVLMFVKTVVIFLVLIIFFYIYVYIYIYNFSVASVFPFYFLTRLLCWTRGLVP